MASIINVSSVKQLLDLIQKYIFYSLEIEKNVASYLASFTLLVNSLKANICRSLNS